MRKWYGRLGGYGMGTNRPQFQQTTPFPALPAGLEMEISMSLVAPVRTCDFVYKFRMHDPEGRGDLQGRAYTVLTI